jgi:hypothetical protein
MEIPVGMSLLSPGSNVTSLSKEAKRSIPEEPFVIYWGRDTG